MTGRATAQKILDSRLLEAVADGDVEGVRKALHAGASVNAISHSGDGQNTPGSSALHFAANYRHREIVALLIENGAEIEKRTKLGETPLLLASMGTSSLEGAAIVELLLQRGAKATTADKKKQTPLHFVTFNSENPDLIEAVIKAGGKINAATNGGRTPLHRAASSGRAANIAVLLRHGADLNARDGSGMQPIHKIADCDNLSDGSVMDAVAVLLDAGADPRSRDKQGRDLADLCNQNSRITQVLAAHDAKKAVSDVLSKMQSQGARPS